MDPPWPLKNWGGSGRSSEAEVHPPGPAWPGGTHQQLGGPPAGLGGVQKIGAPCWESDHSLLGSSLRVMEIPTWVKGEEKGPQATYNPLLTY